MHPGRTYESRYGGGAVKVEQWLAEYMCGREARAKGQELPARFWRLPLWEKRYLRQVRSALSLLKLYPPRAVSAALRTKEGLKIWSLGAPWLDDLCKAEAARLAGLDRLAADLAADRAPAPAVVNPGTRPAFGSAPSTLKKLDG